MSDRNKDVVRAVEEAWDRGDLDALDQYFATDFDNSATAMPGAPPGLAGAKVVHQGAMRSFPDRKVHIEDMIGEGDRVVVRGRVTGTNQGGVPFMNAPANGNPIDVAFISIYRLADGRIAQHWALNDGMALQMQLQA